MMDEAQLREIERGIELGDEPVSEHWAGVVGELVDEVRRQRMLFSRFYRPIPRQQIIEYAMRQPACLERLTDRQRKIFIALHGESDHQKRSRKELAEELQVSVVRIGQIDRDAQSNIRWAMRKDERKCTHCDGSGFTRPTP